MPHKVIFALVVGLVSLGFLAPAVQAQSPVTLQCGTLSGKGTLRIYLGEEAVWEITIDCRVEGRSA